MVDSSLGRTDLPQGGQLGMQARRSAKTENSDVWKPGASLAPVAADLFESLLNGLRHACRLAARVLEYEHADASRLAVAAEIERHRPGAGGGASDDLGDRLDLRTWARSEEGDGEMELLGRNEARANLSQLRQLPGGDALTVVGRKRVGDEEAYSLIAAHASARIHT